LPFATGRGPEFRVSALGFMHVRLAKSLMIGSMDDRMLPTLALRLNISGQVHIHHRVG